MRAFKQACGDSSPQSQQIFASQEMGRRTYSSPELCLLNRFLGNHDFVGSWVIVRRAQLNVGHTRVISRLVRTN